MNAPRGGRFPFKKGKDEHHLVHNLGVSILDSSFSLRHQGIVCGARETISIMLSYCVGSLDRSDIICNYFNIDKYH